MDIPREFRLQQLRNHKAFLVRILLSYAVMKQTYEMELTKNDRFTRRLNYVQSYGHMCMSMGHVLELIKEAQKEIRELQWTY